MKTIHLNAFKAQRIERQENVNAILKQCFSRAIQSTGSMRNVLAGDMQAHVQANTKNLKTA